MASSSFPLSIPQEHSVKDLPAAIGFEIVDKLPQFVYRIDLEGRVTYANQSLLDQLGLGFDQLSGKTAYDMYPKELAEKYRRDDEYVVKEKQVFHTLEENIDPASGEKNIVEVYKVPLFDANGEVIGLQGVFWDISKRYIEEKERLKNEQLFRTIAEQSPNYVILLDEDFRVIYQNRDIEGVESLALGSSIESLKLGDNTEEVAKRLKQTLDSGEMGLYRTRLKTTEGKTLFFDARVTKIWLCSAGARLMVVATDITHHVEQQRELKQASAVFAHSSEAILILDANGVISNVNRAFVAMTGITADTVEGQPFANALAWEINSLSSGDRLFTDQDWHGEIVLRNSRGVDVYTWASVSPVKDSQQRIHKFVVLLSDITEKKLHERQLQHLAHYDALTNLPNRFYFSKELRRMMAEADENQQRMAVLYIDLDGFKSVNDNYGHPVGDRILVEVSQRIHSAMDKQDFLGRLGGDEFIIASPGVDQRKDNTHYYQSILKAISETVDFGAESFAFSASMGITYYPQLENVGGDQLIRQADIAMYEAKVLGKNGFHIFDTEKDRSQRGYGQIRKELKTGITENQLVLFFQPKVNMCTGEVVGAEALVRWQHPSRGLLGPDAFLSATFNDKLALDLDDWVIQNTLRQFEQWKSRGLLSKISINISAKRLESKNFNDFLADALSKHEGIAAGDITLELLESSAVQDLVEICHVIQQCLELGVNFALDDFGTGYSTLNFLKRLPAQELKIDRSFVGDMLEDDEDLAIIRGIVGLAEAFDKSLVAEGVETEAHGNALINLGCQIGQGYAIAKPMPIDEFETWVRGWRQFDSWSKSSKY